MACFLHVTAESTVALSMAAANPVGAIGPRALLLVAKEAANFQRLLALADAVS